MTRRELERRPDGTWLLRGAPPEPRAAYRDDGAAPPGTLPFAARG